MRHTCFGSDDNLMVFNLMQKTGMDLGPPDILPIHNTVY